jgi:hypothetical protein
LVGVAVEVLARLSILVALALPVLLFLNGD